MLSFTELKSLAQVGALDTSTSALSFLVDRINHRYHDIENEMESDTVEETRTGSTVAQQDWIYTPENLIRLQTLYVEVGSNRYVADEISDEDTWQAFKRNTTIYSDILQKVFVTRDRIYLYPTPSTVKTYTLIYETESVDLSEDDYTTGTVSTLANGGLTVTGVGTTWTSAMVGRFLKINSNKRWYRISGVGSTTSITLASPYQGTAISAGTESYTIGELPRLPGNVHTTIVDGALWDFYTYFKKDASMARVYEIRYRDGVKKAKRRGQDRYSSKVINPHRLRGRINPIFYPDSATGS